MTSDKAQIETLIAEIDATLEKPSNLLGRLSGEGAKNRDTLKHLRDYLLNLQDSLEGSDRSSFLSGPDGFHFASDVRDASYNEVADESQVPLFGESTLSGAAESDIAKENSSPGGGIQASVIDGETVYDELPWAMGNAPAGEGAGAAGSALGLTYGESTALIQRLGRDLEQLRAGLMGPLRAEVNQLQHQRQVLAQEIQQLRRQQSASQAGMPSEQLQQSLQAWVARLQEHLVAQITAQVAEALQDMPQADSLNRVADQMEAQTAMTWNEPDAIASTLSIGSASPMGWANAEQSGAGQADSPARQLSSQHQGKRYDLGQDRDLNQDHDLSQNRDLNQEHGWSQNRGSNAIALDGPELTLDSLEANSFAALPDESTSSAGIARRRILAAQDSEFQAQQSLEQDSRRQAGRAAHSLEDFYASVGAATAAQAAQAAQQRAVALQNRAHRSQPGVVKGHYRNLEDALFDGIPEGDNPWAQPASTTTRSLPRSQPSETQSGGSPAYPLAKHRIQRLTDLVDQRFDDFGQAAKSESAMPETLAAFYGDRPSAKRHPAEKKKPLRPIQLRKSA